MYISIAYFYLGKLFIWIHIPPQIDKSTLSNYQTCHDQDPYPIYTVIDQDSKYKHLLRGNYEIPVRSIHFYLAIGFVNIQ